MDKAIIELLARRARLNKALEEFPEDGGNRRVFVSDAIGDSAMHPGDRGGRRDRRSIIAERRDD
jgi:hypothetical protein